MTESEDRPTSILGNISARREELIAGEILTLPVPRWSNPEVLVRYRPLAHEEIRRIQARLNAVPKGKQAAEEVNHNADMLIRGCVAVVARIDAQEYSLRLGDPKGDPTKFDPDLALCLGLDEEATARQVVRGLFLTDGDVIAHAKELVDWSGYRDQEADEALAGE